MLAQILGQLSGSHLRALREHDDVVGFATRIGSLHILGDRFQGEVTFWHDRELGARRDGAEQGQIARFAPHHLDDEGAMV